MICPRCGTINPDKGERCTRCRGVLGRPPVVEDAGAEPSPASSWATGVRQPVLADPGPAAAPPAPPLPSAAPPAWQPAAAGTPPAPTWPTPAAPTGPPA